MKTAVVKTRSDVIGAAAALAHDLGLPLIELPDSNEPKSVAGFDYLFAFDATRLILHSARAEQPGELCVDFADDKLKQRAGSSMRNQNIAKAIGVKGSTRPTVLDATAGLGKDAFLLASLGCEVTLLERSVLLHALLANGLSRAEYYGADTAAILSRMSLQQGEFLQFEAQPGQFDVVYLDPMFPQRRKSAKVKKDMALLQQLLGHQSDGAELLDHALQLARKRVVVKRGKLSAQLGTLKPDIEFKGSSSRYDVYLRV
ncbi:MAG: class I SAM-dependent methyltransferase [Pseudohongiellaceae bacterium]